MLFLIEDNGYAISVPVEVQTPGGSISRVVSAIPDLLVRECDGTDPVASHAALADAAAHCRAGRGPALVHAHVIRAHSHSISDDDRAYRPETDRRRDGEREPIPRFRRRLVADGLMTDAELAAIERDVDAEIARATDEALAAPPPDPATLLRHVYSETVDPTAPAFDTPPASTGEPRTMVELVNACLRDELAANPRMVVFGQDVADLSRDALLGTLKGKGGVFKATAGLQRRFGTDRVFNSPLAEANIVGRAIGMALARPEAGRRDPVLRLHLDGDDADAERAVGAAVAVERRFLVSARRARADRRLPDRQRDLSQPVGRDHLRAHPRAARRDAVDRARRERAAADGDPVRRSGALPRAEAPVPADLQPRAGSGTGLLIPFGRAKVVREGSDLTIVTYGSTVQRSVQAAASLEREDGRSIEIVDLRSLSPYDWPAIERSVRKTSRALVVHEDWVSWGYGAEIAARIGDELFSALDAPVRRVGAADVFCGYHPVLEDRTLPQAADILAAARALLAF